MSRTIRAAAYGALVLLAHTGFAAHAEPTATPSAGAPISERAAAAREVTVDPRAPATECRKVAPTGSRIATRRCTREQPPSTPLARAEDLQQRRDLEQMRTTQWLQEQARAQARAEAMRRRAMGL